MDKALRWQDYIRDIPDFPKPGIVFKDITPMLANGRAFSAAVSELACLVPGDVDAIVGIESRGFIFGAALALQLGIGLVTVRKPGKLPAAVHSIEYELEYGMDRLEIHRDALSGGHKVVVVDDLLEIWIAGSHGFGVPVDLAALPHGQVAEQDRLDHRSGVIREV